MKILIVGDWHSDLHEEEVARSLRRLGHEVAGFKWFRYFEYNPNNSSSFMSLARRAQNKYLFGPILYRMNSDLLGKIRSFRPEMIFIYRGAHIFVRTLVAVKRELPECKLVGYNNDDPFSPIQPRHYWRHFMATIPMYDLMLAYRHTNIADFEKAGARDVALMRSWYVPGRNHPVILTADEQLKYGCDVVFIGHYEDDQRVDYFKAIVQNGLRFKLFGPSKYWAHILAQSDELRNSAPVNMVWGVEYNKALCGAKIALCFFSKLNRDTYTRRCFEIPATGTFMLSEYSDDLAGMYVEGVEAEFFRNRDEMLDKIRFYVNNSQARQKVAKAGLAKVRESGHDIDSRLRDLMQKFT